MKIINEKLRKINKNEWTAADVREAILIFTLAVVNFCAGYYCAMVEISRSVSAI